MRLRRLVLTALVLALAVPLGGRAQTEEDARSRLDVTGYGGRAFYRGACNSAHEVRYGGGYGSYYASEDHLAFRVAAGASAGTVRDVDEDRLDDNVERWSAGGVVAQVGGDWDHFGILIGGGGGWFGDQPIGLIPLTLRLTPAQLDDGMKVGEVRIGLLDDPTLYGNGLLWIELGWLDHEDGGFYTGGSLTAYPRAGELIGVLYAGGEVTLVDGLRLGCRVGWSPSGELPDGFRLQGTLAYVTNR